MTWIHISLRKALVLHLPTIITCIEILMRLLPYFKFQLFIIYLTSQSHNLSSHQISHAADSVLAVLTIILLARIFPLQGIVPLSKHQMLF